MRLIFLMVLLAGAALAKKGANKKKSGSFDEVAKQNEELFKTMEGNGYTKEHIAAVRKVFQKSRFISQGNPKVTKHPLTKQECLARAEKAKLKFANAEFEKICGAKYMAPLYDPAKQKAKTARACIDQFEFPSIPCEFPLVWTRASEAAEICAAVGKRLCDAHEWEGACAGALLEPEYAFDKVKGLSGANAFRKLRKLHNAKHNSKKIWSYGKVRKKGICGMNSTKAKDCNGGDWRRCGSNTYPVGSFLECKSPLEVYDIHGNAAEHMNLPTTPDEMASKGSAKLGHTEMKGSWFIFDKFKAHADHCRWRAPYWHGTRIMSSHSHHNYHLGFRCCKSL